MNIFVLDKDPKIAAKMLCNRHVSKMILESAQMLSSVAHKYGYNALYKPTHVKHPCTIWTGESKGNWDWLIEHTIEMHAEKIRRTGKGHKSIEVVNYYKNNNFGPKEGELTVFAQAMPDKYKDENPVIAYRNYYLGEKQFFKDGKRPSWNPVEPPYWWNYV